MTDPSPTVLVVATRDFMRAHYTKRCAHDPLDLRRESDGRWECGSCLSPVVAIQPNEVRT